MFYSEIESIGAVLMTLLMTVGTVTVTIDASILKVKKIDP